MNDRSARDASALDLTRAVNLRPETGSQAEVAHRTGAVAQAGAGSESTAASELAVASQPVSDLEPLAAEVVASDVEGTLTTGESWRGVGRFLAQHGSAAAYRAFFRAHILSSLLMRAGLADRQRFRDRWMIDLARLFNGMTVAHLRELGEWVVEHELWPGRREAVLGELERHRFAGRTIVLASATYQPILDAFARRIGALGLGTGLQLEAGAASGLLSTPVNSGQAKAQRLRDRVRNSRIVAAYGDTVADGPMLAISEQPVAVFPDRALGRQARSLGWRIWTGAGT